MILSIIPARGGSKVIPRKNIKKIAGKPLLAWTIEYSLESEFINRTVVSTDDKEIAGVARKYGAEVIMRPPELAKDDSPSEDALIHVIDYLRETENYRPDIIVFLQCTSPLRKKDHIDKAIKKFIAKKADSLMSVNREQDAFWDINLSPLTFTLDNFTKLRHNFKPILRENGSFYVIKTGVLKKFRNRLGGKIETYEIPKKYSLEIDNEFDFWLVEKIMRDWIKNEENK